MHLNTPFLKLHFLRISVYKITYFSVVARVLFVRYPTAIFGRILETFLESREVSSFIIMIRTITGI